jgi:asparagine synthase (glutamine-hydrolysing)
MCGICGELRFDGRAPEEATLSRMNEKLVRRGPDDEGLFITGPMGFGHRRLSIIDLSEFFPRATPRLSLRRFITGVKIA